MLGVFAAFETNLRRERQMEGIARAETKGVYKGRKPTIDAGAGRRLKAKAWGPPPLPAIWASAGRLSIGCWRSPLRRMCDIAEPPEAGH